MTPEKQRIAIAEACGKLVPGFTPESLGGFRSLLPNYLGDLNAMHEAEKALQDHTKGWENYCILLRRNFVRHDSVIAATAAQRAEAFLRTLNLWTE